MKIALVTETYPPEVNGVAMTQQRVVRGLTALGLSWERVVESFERELMSISGAKKPGK